MIDSACDFDLLGEWVPQIQDSVCTLALLGCFQLVIYSDYLLYELYNILAVGCLTFLIHFQFAFLKAFV